jgi:hypothetical protein
MREHVKGFLEDEMGFEFAFNTQQKFLGLRRSMMPCFEELVSSCFPIFAPPSLITRTQYLHFQGQVVN